MNLIQQVALGSIVSTNTIRSGILKVDSDLAGHDRRQGFNQYDPFGDTESEPRNSFTLPCSAVSTNTIRSGILKVIGSCDHCSQRTGFNQYDPFGDTER